MKLRLYLNMKLDVVNGKILYCTFEKNNQVNNIQHVFDISIQSE